MPLDQNMPFAMFWLSSKNKDLSIRMEWFRGSKQ